MKTTVTTYNCDRCGLEVSKGDICHSTKYQLVTINLGLTNYDAVFLCGGCLHSLSCWGDLEHNQLAYTGAEEQIAHDKEMKEFIEEAAMDKSELLIVSGTLVYVFVVMLLIILA